MSSRRTIAASLALLAMAVTSCNETVECETYIAQLTYRSECDVEGGLPGDFPITTDQIVHASCGTWASTDPGIGLTLSPTGSIEYEDPPPHTKCGGPSATISVVGTFTGRDGEIRSCEGSTSYSGGGTDGHPTFPFYLLCGSIRVEGIVIDDGDTAHLREPEFIDLARE